MHPEMGFVGGAAPGAGRREFSGRRRTGWGEPPPIVGRRRGLTLGGMTIPPGPLSPADLADLFTDSPSHEPRPSDELVAEVEAELGYRLPAAFVQVSRVANGGMLRRTVITVEDGEDVAVDYLAAIGRSPEDSLLGDLGTAFWIEEWGYPPVGVCVGLTVWGGHVTYWLDYTECGPDGEPRVVEIDQELGYRTRLVAPDFVSFIRGLRVDPEG